MNQWADHETPVTVSSPLRTVGTFILLTAVTFVVMLQIILSVRHVLAQVMEHSGNVALERESWSDAQWAYQTSMRWNSHDYNVLYGLGRASLELLQFNKAQAAFREGLKANPNHVPTQIDLARMLILSKDFEEAEVLLDRAHTNVPNFWRIHQSRATMAEEQGDLHGAITHMEQALLLVLKPLPVHMIQLGNLYWRAEEYAKAEMYALRALELDPVRPSALLLQGRARAEQGRLGEGVALVQLALAEYANPPYDGAAWAEERLLAFDEVTRWLVGSGRYRDALNHLAADVGSEISESSRMSSQEISDIADNLLNGFDAADATPLEWYRLGKVAATGGQYEAALVHYDKALGENLGDLENMCRLDSARALSTLGRYSEAVDRIRQISPPTLTSSLVLAETFEAWGKKASARFEYTTMLQTRSMGAELRADVEARVEALIAAQ